MDLTKALGEDVEGRPRFRITYARRGSLAASKVGPALHGSGTVLFSLFSSGFQFVPRSSTSTMIRYFLDRFCFRPALTCC